LIVILIQTEQTHKTHKAVVVRKKERQFKEVKRQRINKSLKKVLNGCLLKEKKDFVIY